MTQNNPNIDIYDGDTLIILGANGADYDVVGGDPRRDPGYTNHINIAMLTEPGWCGNDLEPVASRRVESKYFPLTKNPVTRQLILDLNKAAEADVKGPEFGDQRAVTTIDEINQVKTAVFALPPDDNLQALALTQAGKNWINQILGGAGDGVQTGGGSGNFLYRGLEATDGKGIANTNDKLLLVKTKQ